MSLRTTSKIYTIKVWGDFAYWGCGPTTGPNRTSSVYPPHGAVDGLFRRILGKREIQWCALEVRLLSIPRFFPMTTNDLQSFDTKPLIPGTNIVPPIVHDESNHTQRTTVYLRNPSYAITAYMVLVAKNVQSEDNTEKQRLALASRCLAHTMNEQTEDTIGKCEQMFERRAKKGQCFDATPTMGVSECSAYYELITDPESLPVPINLTQDYGIQYYDRDWTQEGGPFYYAPMSCEAGIMRYPTWDEVRELGIRRELKRTA